ncbi:hypothetical protein CLD22_04825 [Rubrivivax gelatinosus]|nr:hypothetical protein [Rubrivivax gelatinosus]
MDRLLTRRACLGMGLGAALGVAGCGSLGLDRSLRIDEAELQRLAAREFPLRRRVLEIVEVDISAPRIGLLPEHQRVSASVEVAAHERLFGGRADGRLEFDAALRWAAADQTLRLAEVRVGRFELDSHGGRAPLPAERLGALVVERALEGAVVYRLPPQRAERLRRAGLVPEGIEIEPGALLLRFTDAPR